MTATVTPTPIVKVTTRSNAGGGPGDSLPKRAVIHMVLIFAALIAAFPIIRVLGVALRPGNRLLDSEFALIPEGATLESFQHVLFETDLPRWLFNSLILTTGTAFVGLLIAATSAYAFSRFKFPGRGVGLTLLLATQLIPAAMLLVPLYILAAQLKLTNSYIGMVIGLSVTSVPFRSSSRRPPGSTVAASSRRSGGSSCRCRHPPWLSSSCSTSWPPGTTTSWRGSCSPRRTC